MGYTHYWSFKNIGAKDGNTAKRERSYQLAVKKINKTAKHYQASVPKGSDLRLSGYTAYTDKYGGVNLNGSRGNDHETFCLREHFNENNSDFCKTARKPYDVVVVASLIILKHYLKSNIEIGSDGDRQDWLEGLDLAKEATGLKSLKLPNELDSRLKLVS